ncbi:hypothetical protein PTKIN_Ptkin03bG0140100 [Pterospermum kingtungense]
MSCSQREQTGRASKGKAGGVPTDPTPMLKALRAHLRNMMVCLLLFVLAGHLLYYGSKYGMLVALYRGGGHLDSGQGGAQVELCLLGRFLKDRAINFNVMRNRMAALWRPGKWVCIKDIGGSLFLFQFYHVVNLKRVVEGGLWSFDNHMLILHQLKSGDVLELIPLFLVNYWVHVYKLPVGFMAEHIGKQIGYFIGKFTEYDVNNNTGL